MRGPQTSPVPVSRGAAGTGGTTYRLDLPWQTPPLSLNDRHANRIVEAIAVAKVRESVGWVAKGARMGHHDKVRVTLNYQPRHNGRRDADNLVATLKPCCDALVDADLVDDDTPDHMVKVMPIIHEPDGIRRCLWLDVQILTDSPAGASEGSRQPSPAGVPPFNFKGNPLLARIAVALAGRVWDEPLPELSVGQWIEVVDVIAGCVRRHDAEKAETDRDVRFERMTDAADRGSDD